MLESIEESVSRRGRVELLNRVFALSCIINYYPKKVSNPNMDSAEIVYANVEEIIGKTGKCAQL